MKCKQCGKSGIIIEGTCRGCDYENRQPKRKHVEEYEIVDHGIEHEQYFQGCDISFTEFTDIATGIGDTFSEAIDDALETLAQSETNWDIEDLETRIKAEGLNNLASVSTLVDNASDDEDFDSHHYYVSVRVR